MSTPYYQGLDPAAAPDPVTPADSPSDPSGYASVTPSGIGPAPYDLFDPMANMDLSGAVQAARGAVRRSGRHQHRRRRQRVREHHGATSGCDGAAARLAAGVLCWWRHVRVRHPAWLVSSSDDLW